MRINFIKKDETNPKDKYAKGKEEKDRFRDINKGNNHSLQLGYGRDNNIFFKFTLSKSCAIKTIKLWRLEYYH